MVGRPYIYHTISLRGYSQVTGISRVAVVAFSQQPYPTGEELMASNGEELISEFRQVGGRLPAKKCPALLGFHFPLHSPFASPC